MILLEGYSLDQCPLVQVWSDLLACYDMYLHYNTYAYTYCIFNTGKLYSSRFLWITWKKSDTFVKIHHSFRRNEEHKSVSCMSSIWRWLQQHICRMSTGGKCSFDDMKKWHHMCSQNLVYVASGCNPITYACVYVLKDGRSRFKTE